MTRTFINQLVVNYAITTIRVTNKGFKDIQSSRLSGYDFSYDVTQALEIDKVGIYFARFGHFAVFNINEIINLDEFPEFVNWFISYCRTIHDEYELAKLSRPTQQTSLPVKIRVKSEPKPMTIRERNYKEIENLCILIPKSQKISFYHEFYSVLESKMDTPDLKEFKRFVRSIDEGIGVFIDAALSGCESEKQQDEKMHENFEVDIFENYIKEIGRWHYYV